MHAQLPQMFDATQVAPATGSVGQLPVGEHLVQITGSEIKTTQAGDGGYVQLSLVVVDGPHKGATGRYNLNLFNPNETASRIAREQLSALCHVTGRFQVSDLSVLSGIPFMVKVAPQKGNEEKYTEVIGVMDANGNAPGKSGGPQAAQQGPGPQQPQQPMQQPPMQQQPQQPQQQPPSQQGGWGAPQGGQAQQMQQPAQQQQQQQQPQQGGWQQGNAGGNAPWGGAQS